MKRRRFGLMAGASAAALASSAEMRPAAAQSAAPDPDLLKTTLTPMGSIRAGNADGSIPAWTGGVTAPPLGPNDPQDIPMFEDEKPLYTVDASNMAQYAAMINPGTQELINKQGFSFNVFQTHRTQALPQYICDNNAKNVVNAKLLPQGGQYGFTGAFGGYPFPIVDPADPDAGFKLIWNHLLTWQYGYQQVVHFTAGFVVINGKPLLSYGGMEREYSPWYDPAVTIETYPGYFSMVHGWTKQPPSSDGQETLIWDSSNVLEKPNITWAVVAGQGRVRKAPDEAFDTPDPIVNGIVNYDDSTGFYGSPQKYDWKLVGRVEMLIPYNCNAIPLTDWQTFLRAKFPNPDVVRWEKHRCWHIVATLRPGQRNTTARRELWLDEDTYQAIVVDSYDANGQLVKSFHTHMRCMPHLPGTLESGTSYWDMLSTNYCYLGSIKVPPYNNLEYIGPEPAEYFDPQQMAASASF